MGESLFSHGFEPRSKGLELCSLGDEGFSMGESAGFQGVGPLPPPKRADSFPEHQIHTLLWLNRMNHQGTAPDFLKFSLPGQPPLQSSGKQSARPPMAAGETGPSPGADGGGAGAPGSGAMPCRKSNFPAKLRSTPGETGGCLGLTGRRGVPWRRNAITLQGVYPADSGFEGSIHDAPWPGW